MRGPPGGPWSAQKAEGALSPELCWNVCCDPGVSVFFRGVFFVEAMLDCSM